MDNPLSIEFPIPGRPGGLADERFYIRPATGRKYAMNGSTILSGTMSYGIERTAVELAAAGRYRGDRKG